MRETIAMLTETDILSVPENASRLIGRDWMLITAGDAVACNTMTASWGGLGYLWNRPVAFIFIRPQRHTYGFVERADFFSLSFFEPKFHEALNYLGTVSGRDEEKIRTAKLSPVAAHNTVYFEEARLVMVCRKCYHQDLDPTHFLDSSIHKNYPSQDYHRMYIGEIVKTLAVPDRT